MTIRIGNKEIKVPKFIAEATDSQQKQFHTFLKNVLCAQTNKIRNRLEAENKTFDNLFGGIFGGK